MKYFNLSVWGTAGIFPQNKLFIHGWAFFKLFIAINSGNMLNKVAVWFIFSQFIMELPILFLSWPSAILRSTFSGIVSIIWFFSCVEEYSPSRYALFSVEILTVFFRKRFLAGLAVVLNSSIAFFFEVFVSVPLAFLFLGNYFKSLKMNLTPYSYSQLLNCMIAMWC